MTVKLGCVSGIGIAADCKSVASAFLVRVQRHPFCRVGSIGTALVLKTSIPNGYGGSMPSHGVILKEIGDYMKSKDIVYYARILPSVDIYDVCELKVNTVKDTWFVGIDKHDKRSYLFNKSEINKSVFYDRDVCLRLVNQAEELKKKVSIETYYEEY